MINTGVPLTKCIGLGKYPWQCVNREDLSFQSIDGSKSKGN